jgi:hypothetical protein
MFSLYFGRSRNEDSFRPLAEREIEEYINKYAVLSYAGAFERDAILRFALSDRQLKKVCKAYQRMKGPTLIHCSAGSAVLEKVFLTSSGSWKTRPHGN